MRDFSRSIMAKILLASYANTFFAASGDGINLLLHKPVTVSSSHSMFEGQWLTDGDEGGTFWHSSFLDESPWAKVHLECGKTAQRICFDAPT